MTVNSINGFLFLKISNSLKDNKCTIGAVVVAQLVERPLPTPDVPVRVQSLAKLNIVYNIEKTKIMKKRPGMAHQKTNAHLAKVIGLSLCQICKLFTIKTNHLIDH